MKKKRKTKVMKKKGQESGKNIKYKSTFMEQFQKSIMVEHGTQISTN